MHTWGDKGVDWHGISDSAEEIGDFLVKWGRVNVRDTKEKYGTVRVYLDFGWYQVHSITHPRSMFNRYPKWLWSLDCKYFSRVFKYINYLVVPYHIWLYKLAYKRAVLKRPHLIAEIMYGADFDELLTGLFPAWDKWSDSEHQRLQAEREAALEEARNSPDSNEPDGYDDSTSVTLHAAYEPTADSEAHNGTSSTDNPS